MDWIQRTDNSNFHCLRLHAHIYLSPFVILTPFDLSRLPYARGRHCLPPPDQYIRPSASSFEAGLRTPNLLPFLLLLTFVIPLSPSATLSVTLSF